MNPLQMDSIWVEDDNRNKIYNTALPNMEVLNSDTPLLKCRNTVDLPPLPPTSYFSTLIQEQQKLKKKKSKNVLKNAWKKLSKEDGEGHVASPPKKISTPFGFSHISHVDSETPITNKTFQVIPMVQEESTSSSMGVSCNRTTPQISIPRSHSQATSLASTFSVRASISTTATSRKSSIKHHKHTHTTSSSSIEQLVKLEKYQMNKPVTSTPQIKQTDPLHWDTPSPSNAVRQWITSAHDTTPPPRPSEKPDLKLRHHTVLLATPMRQHISQFTESLEQKFGGEVQEMDFDLDEEETTLIQAGEFSRISRDLMRELSEEEVKELQTCGEEDDDEEVVEEEKEEGEELMPSAI